MTHLVAVSVPRGDYAHSSSTEKGNSAGKRCYIHAVFILFFRTFHLPWKRDRRAPRRVAMIDPEAAVQYLAVPTTKPPSHGQRPIKVQNHVAACMKHAADVKLRASAAANTASRALASNAARSAAEAAAAAAACAATTSTMLPSRARAQEAAASSRHDAMTSLTQKLDEMAVAVNAVEAPATGIAAKAAGAACALFEAIGTDADRTVSVSRLERALTALSDVADVSEALEALRRCPHEARLTQDEYASLAREVSVTRQLRRHTQPNNQSRAAEWHHQDRLRGEGPAGEEDRWVDMRTTKRLLRQMADSGGSRACGVQVPHGTEEEARQAVECLRDRLAVRTVEFAPESWSLEENPHNRLLLASVADVLLAHPSVAVHVLATQSRPSDDRPEHARRFRLWFPKEDAHSHATLAHGRAISCVRVLLNAGVEPERIQTRFSVDRSAAAAGTIQFSFLQPSVHSAQAEPLPEETGRGGSFATLTQTTRASLADSQTTPCSPAAGVRRVSGAWTSSPPATGPPLDKDRTGKSALGPDLRLAASQSPSTVAPWRSYGGERLATAVDGWRNGTVYGGRERLATAQAYALRPTERVRLTRTTRERASDAGLHATRTEVRRLHDEVSALREELQRRPSTPCDAPSRPRTAPSRRGELNCDESSATAPPHRMKRGHDLRLFREAGPLAPAGRATTRQSAARREEDVDEVRLLPEASLSD